LVLSLSLSLSFGRLSSFLVFDRAFAGREEDERNAADGAEREREREIPRRRRHSRCPFGSFKRDLDGTKIGDEKMSNTTTRVLINTGTNDDVRFLSPFTKFSLLRIEANGRERRKKAWRSLVRSFG
tara:strand:- start:1558 stop:1935 length:378 start_codon:yes stop_codon:yes gene_type:complete